MCLKPLNCTFKMFKMINFMLCIFYCNKKLMGEKDIHSILSDHNTTDQQKERYQESPQVFGN